MKGGDKLVVALLFCSDTGSYHGDLLGWGADATTSAIRLKFRSGRICCDYFLSHLSFHTVSVPTQTIFLKARDFAFPRHQLFVYFILNRIIRSDVYLSAGGS